MVLAFTRLSRSEDIILRRESGNDHCVEWRENFMPKETFHYEDEDEAYDSFEKASDFLEKVMEEKRQSELEAERQAKEAEACQK